IAHCGPVAHGAEGPVGDEVRAHGAQHHAVEHHPSGDERRHHADEYARRGAQQGPPELFQMLQEGHILRSAMIRHVRLPPTPSGTPGRPTGMAKDRPAHTPAWPAPQQFSTGLSHRWAGRGHAQCAACEKKRMAWRRCISSPYLSAFNRAGRDRPLRTPIMIQVDLTPREGLQQFFGFSQFKGDQEAIIQHVLEGKNTFVIMPTGGGKSLCYQLPALMSEGTAIVVSPLIALMKNQVDAIRGFSQEDGVAHFLNSSLTRNETLRVRQDISEGRTKILYVAPE